jgi:DNA (cytosine-5)-methyltransferase 1
VKPRLLDLFCGAGGAAMGYSRAGFDVVGVDISPQPNYPFEFVQADIAQWASIDDTTVRGLRYSDFDAVHASPPCQAHTPMSNRWRGKGGRADEHHDLIPATRELLRATGLPYVIENVPGARSSLESPYVLTGEMFGLGVHRPRLFETTFGMLVPQKPPAHPASIGVYGQKPDGRLLWRRVDGTEQRAAVSLEQARRAMGVDWMTWRELAESIPPAYTHFIGHQLLAHLERVAA